MCHDFSDLDSSDEFLTLPNKLGPAASPVIPQVTMFFIILLLSNLKFSY